MEVDIRRDDMCPNSVARMTGQLHLLKRKMRCSRSSEMTHLPNSPRQINQMSVTVQLESSCRGGEDAADSPSRGGYGAVGFATQPLCTRRNSSMSTVADRGRRQQRPNATSRRPGISTSPKRNQNDSSGSHPTSQRPMPLGEFVDTCGLSIAAKLLSKIVGYVPVGSLPSCRRVNFGYYQVVQSALNDSPVRREALDAHLEWRRSSCKRVWVIARARPIDDTAGSCLRIEDRRVALRSAGNAMGPTTFFFDRAFDGSATQAEVCSYVSEQLLPHALNGEHICLMAYGQTGSGKTHTMFGSLEPGCNQGVAFHAVSMLARLLGERQSASGSAGPTIEFSFLECYKDELYDLLDKQQNKLPRQRSSEKHVIPQGLTSRQCDISQMESQVHNWLREGAATRTVGKTLFNPRSSRSHAVVILSITWRLCARQSNRLRRAGGAPPVGDKQMHTRIYLVDLAGSERAGLYAMDQEQLKEGEHINLSLSALGRVVGALSQGKSKHVPYRDSALTWLLKDAITGLSARVCMLAALHPAHAVETASTLRYARQYSSLQNTTGTRARELTAEVRELQRRVDNLKHSFKKALEGDEHSIPWTRESLKGSRVQPSRHAKELVEVHPLLTWTAAHQAKWAVRGQRRDRSAIGHIRSTADAPDGVVNEDGAGKHERVVEVVFEARHGRSPVTLWYPESAVEAVQPPKVLVDTMNQLEQAEEELARRKALLQKAEDGRSLKENDWVEKGS